MSGMAHSPHRVSVFTHSVNGLHEGSVEAHHTRVTCVEHSRKSIINETWLNAPLQWDLITSQFNELNFIWQIFIQKCL